MKSLKFYSEEIRIKSGLSQERPRKNYSEKFSSIFENVPNNLETVDEEYLKSFTLYLGSFLETVNILYVIFCPVTRARI